MSRAIITFVMRQFQYESNYRLSNYYIHHWLTLLIGVRGWKNNCMVQINEGIIIIQHGQFLLTKTDTQFLTSSLILEVK